MMKPGYTEQAEIDLTIALIKGVWATGDPDADDIARWLMKHYTLTPKGEDQTAEDAYIRILDARVGSLAGRPTTEYLIALSTQLVLWQREVESEISSRDIPMTTYTVILLRPKHASAPKHEWLRDQDIYIAIIDGAQTPVSATVAAQNEAARSDGRYAKPEEYEVCAVLEGAHESKLCRWYARPT